MPPSTKRTPIRLVVFDWAGTTVDCGCFAPVVPFVEAFREFGVEISTGEAREPMGLGKRDHVRAIADMPRVAKRWREVHGRDVTDADVNRMYHEQFIPRQMACVPEYCGLVPGLLTCVERLRSRDIKIATSTGYFAEAAEIVYDRAATQGYRPDLNSCPSDVRAGRPAPWMIFRAMEQLDVYPPAAVVKVGDTAPDIEEGLNAGAWTVGVTHTSSDMGLAETDLAALSKEERVRRAGVVAERLRAAGAHFVMDSVADLPNLLAEIEG
jgi:phosphonoacetaldehyde hydrolase